MKMKNVRIYIKTYENMYENMWEICEKKQLYFYYLEKL